MKICIEAYFWMLKILASSNDVFAVQTWANLGKYFETVKYLAYFDKKNRPQWQIIEEIWAKTENLSNVILVTSFQLSATAPFCRLGNIPANIPYVYIHIQPD